LSISARNRHKAVSPSTAETPVPTKSRRTSRVCVVPIFGDDVSPSIDQNRRGKIGIVSFITISRQGTI
jgi:hypothetical protein